MQTFKQQCIALRKQDCSLNEIAEITGRPKTSVYTHIRDIPLSAKKKKQIQKMARERIVAAARFRKGKSTRSFTEFSTWTPKHTLLVAHLFFDGDLMSSKCIYNNRSTALTKRVEKLMGLVYAYEPKRSLDKDSEVYRISYYNVALSSYLKKKSDELIRIVHTLHTESKKEFLRAFFDDEGCMDFRIAQHVRQIRGYQKDKKILLLIQLLLKDFNIQSRVAEPNEIVISGRENLVTFQNEINFSSGVTVNGKRTNSVWGISLQKKEILAQAIASFKT